MAPLGVQQQSAPIVPRTPRGGLNRTSELSSVGTTGRERAWSPMNPLDESTVPSASNRAEGVGGRGLCESLVREIHQRMQRIGRPVQIMEVCGTHTVSIFRHGLRDLLPKGLRLISGPGCPVCVTAQRYIDAAIRLASRPGVIIATYGDMLRVPGADGSLEKQRACGADVRVVTSARGALALARENPGREVAFIGVGFETTAPATAALVLEAQRTGVTNLSVLVSHKLVVPAMIALLQRDDVRLDGFLCPGHVSVIIGENAFIPIVEQFGKPCVVAGFEPAHILTALVMLLRQIEASEACTENAYPIAVTKGGNRFAAELLDRVFQVCDTTWRALGVIPQSGLELRPTFAEFDASRRFTLEIGEDHDHPACRCGDVICGVAAPTDCLLFGEACTPLNPYGPCMVSSEGACSAWFKYGRRSAAQLQSVGETERCALS